MIYHGRFGSALFQSIYRGHHGGVATCLTSLEWQLGVGFVVALGLLWPGLLVLGAAMQLACLIFIVRAACGAPLPRQSSFLARLLIVFLYTAQPLVRGWHRNWNLLRLKRLTPANRRVPRELPPLKRISAATWDLYWESHDYVGRDELLEKVVDRARVDGWSGDFANEWAPWDIKLIGDRWHDVTIYTATEELGWPRRFTRARAQLVPTLFASVLIASTVLWSVASIVAGSVLALTAALVASSILLGQVVTSRRRCLSASASLLAQAGADAGLASVDGEGRSILCPANAVPSKPATPNAKKRSTQRPGAVTSSPANDTHGLSPDMEPTHASD
jgi:hypothetical protein